MGPLSSAFRNLSPNTSDSETFTHLQRLKPSLATPRMAPDSNCGRKGLEGWSLASCGSWDDEPRAWSVDVSRDSNDLEFEDLFEDVARSPRDDHDTQPMVFEQGPLYDRRAVLSSIVAPQTRFCEQLRSDVELLTNSQLSGSKEVDCHRLAQDLWQIKGYTVRICEAGGSCFCLGAHNHAFLEVCASLADQRSFEEVLVVEPALRQHFELARPTRDYSHLLDMLPRVFVGTSGRLLQLVNLVATAMLKSMRQQGMSIPPWRSKQAIMAKWSTIPRCGCGKTSVGIRKSELHVQGRCLLKYEQLVASRRRA